MFIPKSVIKEDPESSNCEVAELDLQPHFFFFLLRQLSSAAIKAITTPIHQIRTMPAAEERKKKKKKRLVG
jgi:hypothetical protein